MKFIICTMSNIISWPVAFKREIQRLWRWFLFLRLSYWTSLKVQITVQYYRYFLIYIQWLYCGHFKIKWDSSSILLTSHNLKICRARSVWLYRTCYKCLGLIHPKKVAIIANESEYFFPQGNTVNKTFRRVFKSS